MLKIKGAFSQTDIISTIMDIYNMIQLNFFRSSDLLGLLPASLPNQCWKPMADWLRIYHRLVRATNPGFHNNFAFNEESMKIGTFIVLDIPLIPVKGIPTIKFALQSIFRGTWTQTSLPALQ